VEAEAKGADALVTQVAGVAESAVLIPVGAALETTDRVVGAIRPWTRRESAERELSRVRRNTRRFERRGSVARNRTLRQVRKQRNRVVRELRKRRSQLTRLARVRRNQANRSIKQNSRRVQTGLRRQRREVRKAVRPQVNRFQRSIQDQTTQTRERVQELV
jgi:DNA anti-recombination protein RmuC